MSTFTPQFFGRVESDSSIESFSDDVEAQRQALEYYERQKLQNQAKASLPPSEASVRLGGDGKVSKSKEDALTKKPRQEEMHIRLKRSDEDPGEPADDLARLLFGGFPKRRSLLSSIFDYSMLSDWGLFRGFFDDWSAPRKPVFRGTIPNRNASPRNSPPSTFTASTLASTKRRSFDIPIEKVYDDPIEYPLPSAPPMEQMPENDIIASLPREVEPEVFKSTTEALMKSLESQGYTALDVGGGGNCLFLALAHQALGSEKHHLELRNLIADEIENNRELYEEDVIALEETDTAVPDEFTDFKDVIFKRYISKIRTPGRIGDAICITAFTRLFDVDVVVFLYDNKKKGLASIVFEWDGKPKGERVKRHIAWIPSGGDEASNHYISVVPRLD